MYTTSINASAQGVIIGEHTTAYNYYGNTLVLNINIDWQDVLMFVLIVVGLMLVSYVSISALYNTYELGTQTHDSHK